MKLIASGVTNSAASVRSPSFSRSSSSTTMTIRPALISATASITSANINPPSTTQLIRRIPSYGRRRKRNAEHTGRRLFLQSNYKIAIICLQCRLNLESPGLEQRLGNILRILIPPSPFAKSRRSNVLVRCKLELFHNLLERCYRRNNRPYRLRLAPVGISTTLCHLYQYPLLDCSSTLRPRLMDTG